MKYRATAGSAVVVATAGIFAGILVTSERAGAFVVFPCCTHTQSRSSLVRGRQSQAGSVNSRNSHGYVSSRAPTMSLLRRRRGQQGARREGEGEIETAFTSGNSGTGADNEEQQRTTMTPEKQQQQVQAAATAAAAMSAGPEEQIDALDKEQREEEEGVLGGSSRDTVATAAAAAADDDGDGDGDSGGGGAKRSARESYAEAARRRIKRARGALEDALDELGRSAIGELGLAPPAYMDLHLDFPLESDDDDDGDGVATAEGDSEEEEEEEESGGGKDGAGWLRQWKIRRGIDPSAAGPGVLSEISSSLGEAMEEQIVAVGESILALDDRVERARASVETALNELGLAIPSAIGGDEEGASGGGVGEGEGDAAAGVKDSSSVGRRWWLPERLRGAEANATAALNMNGTGSAIPGAAWGSGMNQRTAFFRRTLPSIQYQRGVAERAVKRAKDALGTAMDDLGLTPPPVGSTLERFLRADELLGLWRQEEALEDAMQDGDDILPGTDIGIAERRIWVVTTAALPWMTGTSVNPLLRAAYLTRGRDPGKVSLMIPWVSMEDQEYVLPEGKRYATREEQEVYIRDWLRGAGMRGEADDLRIAWYDARYHQIAGCIFPMGDITRLIPDDEADVCILEEPEHLNWFRASGVNWSKKFTHVVGVIHTNYIHYTMADTNHWASGRVKAPFARAFNKVMARAYCDKVIKLSATLQKFAEEKETVTNVHGVRENFLIVGDQRAQAYARGEPFPEGNRPYFLGKMLWEKGYGKLWDLLEGHQEAEKALALSMGEGDGGGGEGVMLGAYGSGPDAEAIRQKAKEMGLSVEFSPATDHAILSQYKTFVNPSQSEVLCTTVAEALAMGKFVIIAEHASNEFFYQFPNTLRFKDQEEFNEQLRHSIANEPTPLTPEHRHVLGWEAATTRLIDSAKVTVRESLRRRRELDEAAWLFHYYLGSGRRGDRVRKIMAGGVVAGQYVHMESVLKEEQKALREAEEMAASAARQAETTRRGA